MAFFSGESRGAPLLDSEMSEAMRRRLFELVGLGWLALALLLALALASYDVRDPSFFSATPEPPRNWLGRIGAHVADPLMRALGLANWGLVAFLAVWGLRFLRHVGEGRITRRAMALPIALVAGALFASTHGPWEGWQLSSGLGGFVGDTLAVGLIGALPMDATRALRALSAASGLLTLGSAGYALGATGPEVRRAAAWMLRSLWQATGLSALMLGRGARRLRARLAEWRAEPRSEKLPPPEPTAGWKQRMLERARRRRHEPPLTAEDDKPLPLAEVALQVETPEVDLAADDEAPPVEAEAAARTRRPARRSRQAERERQPALFAGTEEAPPYRPPPLSLLQRPPREARPQMSQAALRENARMLETVLEDYGVRGEIVAVKPGPVVTLYELEPAPGLKASRIIGLADDIARSMSALSARVSTMPGRSVIGIELPNAERETVYLREVLENPAYGDNRSPLVLALGKNISGQPVVANLARMPHLLIAGTTGSGKSVAINTMILSLLYRLGPERCRLIMIDPKMLELSVYDGIPHLLAPVVTDPKKAVVALKWVVAEMEERYRKMSKLGVRNIDSYNARVRDALARGEEITRTVQTGFDPETGEPVHETETITPEEMPYIVVIVDEMADLMMVAGKEIEACIQRLAQMARASGIHLIMATQRPSVDVITGTIKANFPTRISFQVTSKIDSRTILGEQGAEQLLGQGDMLYMAGGGRITRVHGPFVSDNEVEEVVRYLKGLGRPAYDPSVTEGADEETRVAVEEKLGLASAGDDEDTLYDRAVAIVARDRKCSTSYIQRKLAIGYNKAARLVERMEAEGIVSPANAVGKREILIEER